MWRNGGRVPPLIREYKGIREIAELQNCRIAERIELGICLLQLQSLRSCQTHRHGSVPSSSIAVATVCCAGST
jgi:hypothetical protein